MIGKRGKKFMRFRPCIDIHNGQVKQIVGGSLTDKNDFARENFVSEQDAAFLAGEDLATLCIVSSVIVTTGSLEGERADECRIPCTIAVRLSDAPKCPRCWNHNEHVGGDPEHPDLCPRCAGVVRGHG